MDKKQVTYIIIIVVLILVIFVLYRAFKSFAQVSSEMLEEKEGELNQYRNG
jgi:uncharacterized protein YpmB